MIFHRLGLINKNQRGFTLIEIIMAIAITGLITGGITTAIFQMFGGSARTSNHMTAVRQVQNAGYWVSHDTQMAQDVVTGNDETTGEREILTLTWVGWEYECDGDNTCIDTYKVRYTYDDDSNKLWRREEITTAQYDADGLLVEPQPPPQNSITVVAEYIDPNNTSLQFSGDSTFSLPDVGDAVTITDSIGGDSGVITVTGQINVFLFGTAEYKASTGAWATPSADDKIVLAAKSDDTTGSFTVTTRTATAAITTDDNENATLGGNGVLIFTVTATVSGFPQEQSETRVYEIVTRPST